MTCADVYEGTTKRVKTAASSRVMRHPSLVCETRIYEKQTLLAMIDPMTRRTAARLVILALAGFPLSACSYNTFVSQDQAIKSQWAQVQNQLQRRNDLIPNLVESVKG